MARERQSEKRPGSWRRWIRGLVWLVAGGSTLWAAREVRRLVLDDPRFVMGDRPVNDRDTDTFVVQGVRYARRDHVVRAFERDFGRNVFLIPVAERRRKLLAIDWVEDASVARVWPNRIVVRIEERTPVAFVNVSRDPQHPQLSRLAMIDGEGVILEKPEQSEFSFPILVGVYETQPEAARKERVRRMQAVARDLGPLGKNLSEIDVAGPDVRLVIGVGGRAIDLLVGSRNFEKRVSNFLDHYPQIRKRSEHAAAFDLRIDNQIFTRE